MFKSYNLDNFGEALKKMRTSNRLSQLKVHQQCGINIDTLRRIENGYVIPKYETLELLSYVYKYDLLLLLKHYRINGDIYALYENIDTILLDNNMEHIKTTKDKLRDILNDDLSNTYELINLNDLKQLLLFLEGIILYNNKDKKAISYLSKALKITIHNFNIHHFNNYNYNYFEYRILLLLSLSLIHENDIETSNKLLLFIMNKITDSPILNSNQYKILIKVFANLSYNFHLVDDIWNALLYAEKGIAYSLKHHASHYLFLLYARKGIALYQLNNQNYHIYCQYAIHLLNMYGNTKLSALYRDIFKNQYGIIINC